MNRLCFIVLLFSLSTFEIIHIYPDHLLTPGVVNSSVTQENIHTTICVAGYTKLVRKTTLKMKKQVFERYNIPWSTRNKYEVDHFISLDIGGADVIENLWPQ